MMSIKAGHKDIANYLLDKGANVIPDLDKEALTRDLTAKEALESKFRNWRDDGRKQFEEIFQGDRERTGAAMRSLFQNEQFRAMFQQTRELEAKWPKATDDEKAAIADLASWGREPLDGGRPRAPVVVLTGVELFSPWSVNETWKGLDGLRKRLADAGHVRLDNLWALADATQQIYLGLPSRSEELRRKWESARTKEQLTVPTPHRPRKNKAAAVSAKRTASKRDAGKAEG